MKKLSYSTTNLFFYMKLDEVVEELEEIFGAEFVKDNYELIRKLYEKIFKESHRPTVLKWADIIAMLKDKYEEWWIEKKMEEFGE